MKTEFLKGLGLEQDVIDKIMAENGRDVEKYKAQSERAKAELEAANEQLAKANEQIEAFRGMDYEGVKKAADDYKAKYEEARAKAKAEIERLTLDHAVDSALITAKARNLKAVRALIDIGAIKLNDKGAEGLAEQIEIIKAENGYLFEPDTAMRASGPTAGAAHTITAEDFKKLTYMDKLKIKTEQPALYQQLKGGNI